MRIPAPVCPAVALRPGPYAEVVLHDPDTGRIPAIRQPVDSHGSGR
ncbi:hypothetical protein ACPCUV_28630 [Streptomyces platensis]